MRVGQHIEVLQPKRQQWILAVVRELHLGGHGMAVEAMVGNFENGQRKKHLAVADMSSWRLLPEDAFYEPEPAA